MKIRNGFVSNSSSSSFLVLFPKEITNFDELYDLMWTEKNSQSIQKSYNFINDSGEEKKSYNSMGMTFDEFKTKATNYVLEETLMQNNNNIFFALSNMSNSWIDDLGCLHPYDCDIDIKNIQELKDIFQEYDKLQNEYDNFDWSNYNDQYDIISDKLSDMYWVENIKKTFEKIEEILEKNKSTFFYSYIFSDECGTFFSALEHGGIFGDLPVFVESHH